MKKEDCKIIEDLLLNYSDDVLNPETKEIVEKHLKECKECKINLENIKSEKNNDNQKEKIEINYLKKLRRKTAIKSILIAILIVFIIFTIWYLYKLNIINNMAKVYKEYENSDYYVETIFAEENQGRDNVLYNKKWRKGNKVKTEYGIVKEDGTYEVNSVIYATIGQREEIRIDTKENIAYKYKDYFEETNNVPLGMAYTNNAEHLIVRLGAPFHFRISKDTRDIGRWYYVLSYGDSKMIIDKQTFEPIREEGFSCSVEYFNNTNVVKKRNNQIYQIVKLEKNNVKDEDIEVNLNNYKVIEEKDRNIEDLS